MVNSYTQEEVRELVRMIEEDPGKTDGILSPGIGHQTFTAIVRAYKYKLPRYEFNPFFWTGANEFLYKVPFKDVPLSV